MALYHLLSGDYSVEGICNWCGTSLLLVLAQQALDLHASAMPLHVCITASRLDNAHMLFGNEIIDLKMGRKIAL